MEGSEQKKTKLALTDLPQRKRRGQRLRVVTAYDYPTALIADRVSDIDMILVGDSLAMVVLGHESTTTITMDEMIHHMKAVTRAAKSTLVVGDMPFMSYNISVPEAIRNAGRLIQEGRVDAVKLEGGEGYHDTVRAIVRAGIPVLAHVGLTPQTATQLGGYRVQGRDADSALRIYQEALRLEEAGAFGLVLECVPAPLARAISERLTIPTIGIGAGPGCDGQVLVLHDMIGLYQGVHRPRFAKQYAAVGEAIEQTFRQYAQEVQSGAYPAAQHSFAMNQEEWRKLQDALRAQGHPARD